MKHIVILGAGTAGTIMANRLTRLLTREVRSGALDITIVDRDDQHLYQPGLLFIPFGIYERRDIVRSRHATLPHHVRLLYGEIDRVDTQGSAVVLTDGRALGYDVLIVATGARTLPGETAGLTGHGWYENAFDFFSLEGAEALRTRLDAFPGGRLVVNVMDMPIKCPVAPLEFAFLADWFFTKKGMRDKVQLTYATPLDAAFTRPVAAARLAHLLAEKDIELVTEFNVGSVDGTAQRMRGWDDRELAYDLLVTVPLHGGASFVGRSQAMGDDFDFVRTHKYTLQALAAENIFAIGDATDLPTSKAGSVAHFESEVLAPNIARFLHGVPLAHDFDGHANCFVETGHDKALLIDFNYDTEPLPGDFPFAGSPLPLLEESRLAHQAKRALRWVYWNLLLPGHAVPGLSPQLSMAGKHAAPVETHTFPDPRAPQTKRGGAVK
ncbi:MAG: NAD(P)/FAD-dependent oxidoreductase [Gemmatimonadetes bacterium]|nr:NAD(P)/FAD-dependent oxidoreductase [Gemmatimonadota bacterium]